MKKTIMIFGLTAVNLLSFATSRDLSEDMDNASQVLNVVNVCDLADGSIDEILQSYHPETAIEFSEHTTLPVGFFLQGDLLNFIEQKETFGNIEVKQRFYLRCLDNELLFSVNLKDWKPFTEFATGYARVILHVENHQPLLEIGADFSVREIHPE